MQPKKAGVRGKKILDGIRAIINLARAANYSVEWIPGYNGHCLYWANRIEIGRDLPNTQKLIVLAHELGHVFDYTENFPQLEEMVTIMEFWDIYKVGERYFQREKQAWVYGRLILEHVGAWKTVQKTFREQRKSALISYRRRMESAKKSGRAAPEKTAFAAAMRKVQKLLSEHGHNKALAKKHT